jgi:DinB superfamily
LNPSFQTIFNAVERQRAEILSQVKQLPPDRYMLQPSPAKWSIAQILTHLLTSEKFSIGYMKKKMLGIDQLNNSGIAGTLRFTLLQLSQRIPILKFKAPNVVVANTPQALPFDELVSQWDELRNDLKSLLESIEEKNIKKAIYKHPLAGRLDAAQATAFFYEHTHHHLPQIKRLL